MGLQCALGSDKVKTSETVPTGEIYHLEKAPGVKCLSVAHMRFLDK